MWLIGLTMSLFNIIKTKALECVSVVNQKCMSRPKILDVNEGVGEALFFPYSVLINKCSGSCDTLYDPLPRLCVPNIIKGVNMKVYNFLMRLNETRNVLWHKSCKWVCELNSSVCNKLIGRVIEECTSIINETMINNRDNIDNDNTVWNIFMGLFSVVMFIGAVCFCVLNYFKWITGKKLFKKYTNY